MQIPSGNPPPAAARSVQTAAPAAQGPVRTMDPSGETMLQYEGSRRDFLDNLVDVCLVNPIPHDRAANPPPLTGILFDHISGPHAVTNPSAMDEPPPAVLGSAEKYLLVRELEAEIHHLSNRPLPTGADDRAGFEKQVRELKGYCDVLGDVPLSVVQRLDSLLTSSRGHVVIDMPSETS